MSDEKRVPHQVIQVAPDNPNHRPKILVADQNGHVVDGIHSHEEYIDQAVRCLPFADALADAVEAERNQGLDGMDEKEHRRAVGEALAAYRTAQKGE